MTLVDESERVKEWESESGRFAVRDRLFDGSENSGEGFKVVVNEEMISRLLKVRVSRLKSRN